MISYLAKQAGLNPCGYEENGDVMYIGTKKQWELYEKLEKMEEQELEMADEDEQIRIADAQDQINELSQQ